MAQKWILAITALVLAFAPAAMAADDIKVSVETTYLTRYLFYGIDRYADNDGAIQPAVTLDFGDTGFSAKVLGSWSTKSMHQNAEDFQYSLLYAGSFGDGPLATSYVANYTYYDVFGNNSKDADLQEAGILFAWPNVCAMGIVPHYRVVNIWQTSSDNVISPAGAVPTTAGFVHAFGAAYSFTTPGIINGTAEQTFNVVADLVYNDGFGAASVDHDFTHAVVGISTAVPVGELTVVPALYYQISMDDSVNRSDEIYGGVTVKYSF